MKAKAVIPREQANRDVDEAVAYYLSEAGEAVALGFIDALEKAYGHIGRHPATGSPRYAHELNLPGLRAWPTTYTVMPKERQLNVLLTLATIDSMLAIVTNETTSSLDGVR